MRIVIDCRFASMHVGLGRYTRQIVQGLTIDTSHEFILLVKDIQESWIPAGSHITCTQVSASHYSIAEQVIMPLAIFRAKADVFFCPHFNVPLVCPIPFVATVHDLILHRYPNTSSKLKIWAYKCILKNCINRAKKIIAVSKFTRSELQAHYPSQSLKIEMIHEGIEKNFTPANSDQISALLKRLSIDKNYVLYVGNAKEHKNVQMLINAYAKSSASSTHILVLVCFGSEAGNLDLHQNVLLLTKISDTDLPVLYSGADAFVTASLYEGFCFPVLEARACGTKVLASNVSAIPEVAGKCVLIDPTEDNFVEKLNSIYTLFKDTDVADFDWQKTSDKTLSVLESI